MSKTIMNNRYHYGWSVILLHWLLFLLIAGMMIGGKVSAMLEGEDKIPLIISIHKQLGIAVLVLMVLRFVWRMANTSVTPLTEDTAMQLAATINHWLLYLVVMGQAVIGIAMSQAAGRSVDFLGLEMPLLGGAEGALVGMHAAFESDVTLRLWHTYGGYVLLGLIVLHILAALMHHFIHKDDTLRRMWFGYEASYEHELHSHQI